MFAQDGARKLAILIITCVGFFMVLLDTSIVNVALPTIQTDFHASLADLQWMVDAYTLPFAALLLTAGSLGDRFGRKRLFLIGLIGFTLGSALCALAPNLQLLIAGRALQGAGGAALSPGSLSLLVAAFTDHKERTQALGIWSGISGLALAAGPVVGGVLIRVSNWPAIFFVNLPIGALVFIFGWRILAESRNPHARRLDLPGQVLAIAGLASLTYALIEGESAGWTSPLILSFFASAAAFLIAFLVVEARVREPLLPLQLFKSVAFSTANAAAVVVGFALLSTIFFVTQYFQSVQGYSALDAGLRTLPSSMGIFLTAPVAGQVAARFSPRVPITLGALLSGVALLLLIRLDPTTSYANIWWNQAMYGIGFGLMLSPLTAAGLSTIPQHRAGLGSAVLNTSRQIGNVFGIALLGALVEQQFINNLFSKLSNVGIPGSISQKMAATIANAGAEGGQVQFSGSLPVASHVLHQVINQAFTDSLHISFLTTGTLLLFTGVVCALLLKVPRRLETDKDIPSDTPEELVPVSGEI